MIFLVYLSFFSFIYFLFSILLRFFIYLYYRKKCHYDCSSCKYWPCPAYRCNKKRFERRSSDE